LRISIVIPAFNEAKLIVATLRHVKAALQSFAARGWESELIVCDNNSTDQTAALARTEGARVVFEPVNQISRARNTGAAAATGDWLLFVDADSSPTAELFADMAAQIAGGRCLAGGSTLQIVGDHRVANAAVRFWNWLSRWRRVLAGSFIFCEAAAFRALGGFSEELFAAEEIDLSRRLKTLSAQQGKEIVILDRHPLLSSARKVELYTIWEHLRFVAGVVASRGRAFRSREGCFRWYDGRR
jgi:glycosyltransferase involved in cell wall biosynthesis